MRRRRRADRVQMPVADGIDDGVAIPLLRQAGHGEADRVRSLLHGRIGTRPTVPSVWRARTRTSLASFIGVSGWFSIPLSLSRWLPDEQMALVHGSGVGGEHRAGQGEAGVERAQQRVGYRTDIALIRAVEGRTVFEEKLPAASPTQPLPTQQALPDRIICRRRAPFQRYDHGVGIRYGGGLRNPDHLHRPHAVAHQHGGRDRSHR